MLSTVKYPLEGASPILPTLSRVVSEGDFTQISEMTGPRFQGMELPQTY